MTDTRLRERPDMHQAFDMRGPLPALVPRRAKRDRDRTGSLRAPAHVRVIRVVLDDDDLAMIRRKLGLTLGKFATSIERISVRITDTNGPRGGVDQVCKVKVVLSGLPSVVIERRDAELHSAVDVAVRASAQAVRRSIRRRRMKPLRYRHSAISVLPKVEPGSDQSLTPRAEDPWRSASSRNVLADF